MFLGFSVISCNVGVYPAFSSTFISPALSRTLSDLPPLVASLGIATFPSSLISFTLLTFLEYNPKGAISVSPIASIFKFFSLTSLFKYA